jgi:hypothetical protein
MPHLWLHITPHSRRAQNTRRRIEERPGVAAPTRSGPESKQCGQRAQAMSPERAQHIPKRYKQSHLYRLGMGIWEVGFGTIRFLQRACVGTAVVLRSDAIPVPKGTGTLCCHPCVGLAAGSVRLRFSPLLHSVRSRCRGRWAQARSDVTLLSDSLPELLGAGSLPCCTRFGRDAGAGGRRHALMSRSFRTRCRNC